jgi:hypothetical protein
VHPPTTADEAIANAHEWFEHNSGWAPPDEGTLLDWDADAVCRAPDDCLVESEHWCEHGLASWRLILLALDDWPVTRRRRPPSPER